MVGTSRVAALCALGRSNVVALVVLCPMPVTEFFINDNIGRNIMAALLTRIDLCPMHAAYLPFFGIIGTSLMVASVDHCPMCASDSSLCGIIDTPVVAALRVPLHWWDDVLVVLGRHRSFPGNTLPP